VRSKINAIAGSKIISEEDWKKVLKAFKSQRKTDKEEKIFS
jgi:hypothetical protein